MNIHFILHENFEAPGAYLLWAQERGHETSMTRVYQFEQLPESSAAYDMLIVMGGPQDPRENRDDFPYYRPQEEIDFIKQFIADNKPIVGICLGSQLLGEAYGARFEHSPETEIGNFPIRLTEAGLADAYIKHFGSELVVGHWHNDMPGLVEGAVVLATSQGCPRQIVRYGDKHYAFQCHMELTTEVVELLIASETDLAQKSREKTFVQSPEDLLAYDYSLMNQNLYQFLDQLTSTT